AIERLEKRNALDVVPVKVRKENVRAERIAVHLLMQLVAQVAEAGAAVEDVETAVEAQLHARRVAAVSQIFLLRGGRRSAYTPKSHQHFRFTCSGLSRF